MKFVVLLTTDRERADRMLARVCGDAQVTTIVAFANDDDRDWLAARHARAELRRDKPPGGKVAFVRALRREGFARCVVAWHGGERFSPLRLVALALGCPVQVVDDRDRVLTVSWWQPWTWAGHLLRRGITADPLFVARCLAGCYRATIGLFVALVWLPVRRALARTGRRPGRPA